MIKLNIIENVDFSTAGNGQITRTQEGKEIGGIPDWECLIDPAYIVSGKARQRAKPQAVSSIPLPTTISKFSNGLPAFAPAAAG